MRGVHAHRGAARALGARLIHSAAAHGLRGGRVRVVPAGAGTAEQGFGWTNRCGKGNAEDTVTSGLEGAWTSTPTQWSMMYLSNLYAYDWEKTRSPAGAIQWTPKDGLAAGTVPAAVIIIGTAFSNSATQSITALYPAKFD